MAGTPGLFPKPGAPRVAAGGSIHGVRVLMGVLLALIATASIVGVIFTATSGQTDLAIVIGIFSAAFFSRVLC